ncbi:MAG: hypothetical protein J2P21_24450 [Chloracidobacterium sp.]|nr:hypothetical protein [Chloracidobacterium sp.]
MLDIKIKSRNDEKVFLLRSGDSSPKGEAYEVGEEIAADQRGLGLSQNGLIDLLELPDTICRGMWETGYREHTIITLIKYAKAANVCLEILVDNRFDLPAELPPRKGYHPFHKIWKNIPVRNWEYIPHILSPPNLLICRRQFRSLIDV